LELVVENPSLRVSDAMCMLISIGVRTYQPCLVLNLIILLAYVDVFCSACLLRDGLVRFGGIFAFGSRIQQICRLKSKAFAKYPLNRDERNFTALRSIVNRDIQDFDGLIPNVS